MTLDLLASTDIVGEIFKVSPNASGAQEAVQISLAPVFLLVAIGGVMNVMMNRLIWIAGRIERLEEQTDAATTSKGEAELTWLRARQHRARWAIMFSTASGVIISILVALLFVSTYMGKEIGPLIAFLWVATMAFLITGLILFLLETRLAARGAKSVRRKD